MRLSAQIANDRMGLGDLAFLALAKDHLSRFGHCGPSRSTPLDESRDGGRMMATRNVPMREMRKRDRRLALGSHANALANCLPLAILPCRVLGVEVTMRGDVSDASKSNASRPSITWAP